MRRVLAVAVAVGSIAWLAAVVACASGCDDQDCAAATPEPPPPREPSIEPIEEEDDESVDEEVPEEEAPLDVDAMSEDELESACFQGSQAACDRLGH